MDEEADAGQSHEEECYLSDLKDLNVTATHPSTLCEYYYYWYTFRLFFFNDDP
jgi:hypothetical protein